MIFRKLSERRLYDVDNAEGTQTTTQTDTQQQQSGTEEKPKLFTQEELSKVAAKEARDAKAKAEKAFLERHGVTSEDELKSLLTSFREKQEAEKTEAQKLQDEITNLKRERDSEKLQREEALKLARLKERDSELKALLTGRAHDEKQVLILLKNLYADKMETLLSEDGNFDTEEAQKLIAEYQKANPFMFKSSSPGSPSNNNGAAPQANEEARKALSEMVGKATKGF